MFIIKLYIYKAPCNTNEASKKNNAIGFEENSMLVSLEYLLFYEAD